MPAVAAQRFLTTQQRPSWSRQRSRRLSDTPSLRTESCRATHDAVRVAPAEFDDTSATTPEPSLAVRATPEDLVASTHISSNQRSSKPISLQLLKSTSRLNNTMWAIPLIPLYFLLASLAEDCLVFCAVRCKEDMSRVRPFLNGEQEQERLLTTACCLLPIFPPLLCAFHTLPAASKPLLHDRLGSRTLFSL